MMDGISAMDTGNNGQMLNMNIESIAEVKVLTQGYQAEYGRSSGLQITAVTKSGTNRFRGSRLRHQHQLRLERRTAGLNEQERRPEAGLEATTLRLLHRRSGRQAGRQQQAVLLLQPRVPSDEPGDQQRQPDPSRVPTALERAGDFSQTLDNNGALFNFIKDPHAHRRVQRDRPGGCFARRRRARQDSGEPAVSDRPGDPEPLSAAELGRRPPGTNYNYELGGRRPDPVEDS